MERSHSGLVRSPGTRVDPQGSRGFESLPLRHIRNPPEADENVRIPLPLRHLSCRYSSVGRAHPW